MAGNSSGTQCVWSTDGLNFPKYPGNWVLPLVATTLSSDGEESRLRAEWRGPCVNVS